MERGSPMDPREAAAIAAAEAQAAQMALRTFPEERSEEDLDKIWSWLCRVSQENERLGKFFSLKFAQQRCISALCKSMKLLSLPTGTVVYKQHEAGTAFYIVLRGEVEIRHVPFASKAAAQREVRGVGGMAGIMIPSGQDRQALGDFVTVLGPGQHFGMLSALGDHRDATAVSLGAARGEPGTKTELLLVDANAYRNCTQRIFQKAELAVNKRVQYLSTLALFKSWPTEEVTFLCHWLTEAKYSQQTRLFDLGRPAANVFLVVHGTVGQTCILPDGRLHNLEVCPAPYMLGDIEAFCASTVYQSTAIALDEDTRVWSMPLAVFKAVVLPNSREAIAKMVEEKQHWRSWRTSEAGASNVPFPFLTNAQNEIISDFATGKPPAAAIKPADAPLAANGSPKSPNTTARAAANAGRRRRASSIMGVADMPKGYPGLLEAAGQRSPTAVAAAARRPTTATRGRARMGSIAEEPALSPRAEAGQRAERELRAAKKAVAAFKRLLVRRRARQAQEAAAAAAAAASLPTRNRGASIEGRGRAPSIAELSGSVERSDSGGIGSAIRRTFSGRFGARVHRQGSSNTGIGVEVRKEATIVEKVTTATIAHSVPTAPSVPKLGIGRAVSMRDMHATTQLAAVPRIAQPPANPVTKAWPSNEAPLVSPRHQDYVKWATATAPAVAAAAPIAPSAPIAPTAPALTHSASGLGAQPPGVRPQQLPRAVNRAPQKLEPISQGQSIAPPPMMVGSLKPPPLMSMPLSARAGTPVSGGFQPAASSAFKPVQSGGESPAVVAAARASQRRRSVVSIDDQSSASGSPSPRVEDRPDGVAAAARASMRRRGSVDDSTEAFAAAAAVLGRTTSGTSATSGTAAAAAPLSPGMTGITAAAARASQRRRSVVDISESSEFPGSPVARARASSKAVAPSTEEPPCDNDIVAAAQQASRRRRSSAGPSLILAQAALLEESET